MPLTVDTTAILSQYVNGVMSRSDHHAQNISEVILAIIGAVIWKATSDVKVRTYNGETANVLWMSIEQKDFAFTYNHQNGVIELRSGNQNGSILATFDNSVSNNQVKQIFLGL